MFKSKKKVMSDEEIRELSEKIAKDITTKQAETLMDRANEFADENGKLDPIARMAMTIKECNNFTKEYVAEMLIKVLNEQ